jgi:hypothetical protein
LFILTYTFSFKIFHKPCSFNSCLRDFEEQIFRCPFFGSVFRDLDFITNQGQ